MFLLSDCAAGLTATGSGELALLSQLFSLVRQQARQSDALSHGRGAMCVVSSLGGVPPNRLLPLAPWSYLRLRVLKKKTAPEAPCSLPLREPYIRV